VSNVHFFDNLDEDARPLEEVRITDVRVDVLPDGRRVAISIALTPFLEKPDIDVTLWRDDVEERSLSVVGAMQPEMQLTLHLPSGDMGGLYTVRVDLLRQGQVQDARRVTFEAAPLAAAARE
jgi:hypothetical protein